jgi:hypothetical protein
LATGQQGAVAIRLDVPRLGLVEVRCGRQGANRDHQPLLRAQASATLTRIMQPVHLDYTVLGGASRQTALSPGESWTFGRSQECTETLTLPQLSRVALVVQRLDPHVVRISSRQSNRGRVVVVSDEGLERHVIGFGSGPVHLAGGNYTLKVELPPVVLRMQLSVPVPQRQPAPGTPPRWGARVDEKTALSWSPELDADEGQPWIAVAALAVTLVRYPDVMDGADERRAPGRLSDRLRQAVAAWCGRTSLYWVNERLKDAVTAADLEVPAGADRLPVVVAHYDAFFSDATIRGVRDRLSRLVGDGS